MFALLTLNHCVPCASEPYWALRCITCYWSSSPGSSTSDTPLWLPLWLPWDCFITTQLYSYASWHASRGSLVQAATDPGLHKNILFQSWPEDMLDVYGITLIFRFHHTCLRSHGPERHITGHVNCTQHVLVLLIQQNSIEWTVLVHGSRLALLDCAFTTSFGFAGSAELNCMYSVLHSSGVSLQAGLFFDLTRDTQDLGNIPIVYIAFGMFMSSGGCIRELEHGGGVTLTALGGFAGFARARSQGCQ